MTVKIGLVRRCQHKKGGYRTANPTRKVVQRWLQLAELAAPQSDHQLGLLLSEARQPRLYTGHRRQHFSPTRVSLSLRPKESVQVTHSPAPPSEPPSHSLTRCQDVKMEADPKEPWWTSWGHDRSPRLRLLATPGSDLVGPSLLPGAAPQLQNLQHQGASSSLEAQGGVCRRVPRSQLPLGWPVSLLNSGPSGRPGWPVAAAAPGPPAHSQPQASAGHHA
ncbi:uncharacterized protein [Physeter macrocephalus]|uniref:Uncharacterized protein n=1 Tax=Physeter macrocephalus TaxID=9755 RepID=A0A9W2WG47_PHYMC|nr:uncharacterized protein LOC129391792 [Physeter catodon]